MVNKKNGDIVFDSFKIYKGMKKSDFLNQIQAEEIFSISNPIEVGVDKLQNIMLNIQSAQNRFFSIRIYFKNEIVDWVIFGMRKEQKLPRWEEWNAEEEKHLYTEYSLWLKKELGRPPYIYDWGEVWVEMDAHTQTSNLGLRYSASLS